jgi:hypothetical protein
MDIFSAIISGFGLSAPAGLNAWLPLLIAGLAHRLELFNFKLNAPFDVLGNTWALVALGVLLLIEIFADKVPAIDSVNDMIHTFIRPAAGGILFAGHSGVVASIDPAMAFILGLLAAGGVHAVKATSRPVVTATTGGIGNPIVSFLEDIVAGVSAVLALFAPLVAALIMASILGLAFYVVWRWRTRRRRGAII